MNNAASQRLGRAVRRHAAAATLLAGALGLAACGAGTGAAGPTGPAGATSLPSASAPSSSAAPSMPPASTASAATSKTASTSASTAPTRPSHKPSPTKATTKAARKPAPKKPSSLKASAASRRRLVASCVATSKGLNEAVKAWNDAVSSGSDSRLDGAAQTLRATAETVLKRGHRTGDRSFERLSKAVANDLAVMAIRHDRGEDVYGGTLTEHSKQLRAYCAKKL